MFIDQTPDQRDRTYAQIMQEQRLAEERGRIDRELADRHNAGELHVFSSISDK